VISLYDSHPEPMMTEPPCEEPSPEDQLRDEQLPEDQLAGAAPAGVTAFSGMDASRLLVRALAQLPPDDRDKVYTWLLGTSLRAQPGPMSQLGRRLRWAVNVEAGSVGQQDFGEMGAQVVRDLFRGSSSPAQQMVPVRFSTEQHARLRAWCAEHGFSMATVIRGLVDRFLDSQQAQPG
jgi:ParG